MSVPSTLTLTLFENGNVIAVGDDGKSETLSHAPEYGSVTVVVGEREFIVIVGSFTPKSRDEAPEFVQ